MGALQLLCRADKAGTQTGALCRGMHSEHGKTTGTPRSHRARRFAIRLQDLANIFFLAAAVVHDGVPQPCGTRSDGPSMCTARHCRLPPAPLG